MERTMIQLVAAVMVFLTLGFQPVSSQVNITNAGCNTTKFCLESPVNCDPAKNSTCLFGSARPTALNVQSRLDVAFELSGNSTGYIALGLTQNATEGIPLLFVCAQNSSNNGTFLFRTMSVNSNNSLNSVTKNATGVTNSVNGANIKCTFSIADLNATALALTKATADTTFAMVIGSGVLNGDQLGAFQRTRSSDLINLASFLSTNSTNTTTTSAPSGATSPLYSNDSTNTTTTAAPSGANRPLYSNAALLLLSFLTTFLLKFA